MIPPSQPSQSPVQAQQVRPRAVSGRRSSGRFGEPGSPPPPLPPGPHLEQAAALPVGARMSLLGGPLEHCSSQQLPCSYPQL